MRLNAFFQLHYRRLRARYQDATIDRHWMRIRSALYRRRDTQTHRVQP